MNLYLIRGIPGAGKTTLAKLLVESLGGPERVAHHEADHFFERPKGYVYNPKQQGIAHMVCEKKATTSMQGGYDNVIVSNTFIKRSSLLPYYKAAQRNGYEVIEYVAANQFNNIHGIEPEKIYQMMRDFEL